MFGLPETIHSPTLGQRLTFDESADEVLRMEAWMDVGSSTPMHVHQLQSESFEVVSGELTIWVAGQRCTVRPGETVVAEAGVPHRFHNGSGEPVRAIVEIRPAMQTRALFQAMFELDHAGRMSRSGSPGVLDASQLMHTYRDEFFYLAQIPIRMQLLMTAPMAAIARLRKRKGTS